MKWRVFAAFLLPVFSDFSLIISIMKVVSMKLRYFFYFLGMGISLAATSPALASSPGKDLITPEVIGEIRDFIDQEIVRLSILSQNEKYKNFTELDVLRMDEQWVKERSNESQPLISATLSNPLSSYLTRVQAHSYGLYTEIFVMDRHGLNVGQSSISSDYWQGDEAKFQKTYPVGGAAIFIDEPEYNDDINNWQVQVNVSISDGKNEDSIGAATIEVNLTELQRRNQSMVKKPAVAITPATQELETEVLPQAEGEQLDSNHTAE
jgi:hypothetical protein